jgi:uroporphyrinogen III methyltransferase/synthase
MATKAKSKSPSPGTVYLVGAGPGDAGLLTLRGAELLGRADVVVYDALVNPELLKLAPKSAQVIYGGKRAKDHAIPQDELNRLLVQLAREGKTVVRLKGGDPYIFGRGGEEAEELAAAGVPFEVVPGISSIVAAPNYAGIPLTHRDHCSAFMVITGHEDPTKEASSLDWAQIARTPGTKVVLMGVERIGSIAAALIQGGMDAATPVALVRWGTTGRQQSLVGTLETIAGLVARTQFQAPAVTIIGDVVKLRDTLNWFERRPLFGRRIVVTRTREQASQLSHRLLELGAEVLEIPTIKITEPANKQHIADAFAELGSYEWIVFTSPNGVTAFFDYLFKIEDDIRTFGALRVAAVGPATAAKLKELHIRVDLMPERYVTADIARAFRKLNIENAKILLARAEQANPDLPRELEKLGAIVDDVAFYRTVPETEDVTGAAAQLQESGADWLTFTSSSTVEHFHARFDLPKLLARFPQTRIASIGPETSKTLAALGVPPTVEADPHTIEGLLNALLRAP